jgi:hypothetical protein
MANSPTASQAAEADAGIMLAAKSLSRKLRKKIDKNDPKNGNRAGEQ